MTRRGFIGLAMRALAVLPVLRVLEPFEPYVEDELQVFHQPIDLAAFSRMLKERGVFDQLVAQFNAPSPFVLLRQGEGGRTMEIPLRRS